MIEDILEEFKNDIYSEFNNEFNLLDSNEIEEELFSLFIIEDK